MEKEIKPFLDEEGRVKMLPSKTKKRWAVLRYLAGKFEGGREYTEKEINAICDEWHTFGDYFLVRRELVEAGFLGRLPNGSRYWLNEMAEDEGEAE